MSTVVTAADVLQLRKKCCEVQFCQLFSERCEGKLTHETAQWLQDAFSSVPTDHGRLECKQHQLHGLCISCMVLKQ